MLRLVVEATQWAAVRTWVWSSKEPPQNNPPLLLKDTSIRFKWEDFLCIYVRWLRVTMKGNSCGEASTPLTILSWISWPAHHIIWIWSLGIKNRLVELIFDLLFVLAVKPTSLLRWWRRGWLWNSCERPSSSLKFVFRNKWRSSEQVQCALFYGYDETEWGYVRSTTKKMVRSSRENMV